VLLQFIGAPGGLVSPWDMITIAWTPLRSAVGRIRSCMPQMRRWVGVCTCWLAGSLLGPASWIGNSELLLHHNNDHGKGEKGERLHQWVMMCCHWRQL